MSGNIISDNTVYDCQDAIYFDRSAGANTNNDILHNITYNDSTEVGNEYGISIYRCDNISVHGNDVAYSNNTGVLIDGSDYIDVIGNLIHDNSEGIYARYDSYYVYIYGNDIRDNEGVTTGVYVYDAYDVDIRYNNIVGNSEYGVLIHDLGTASAQYNWWGHYSGPGGSGPGSGDAVGPNIDFTPWLTQELLQPPEMFYGRILTRPNADSPFFNASAGTVITAYVLGMQKGSITVTTAGQYGNHPGTYLIVQGNIAEGSKILFYVNGYQAIQTDTFESGAVTPMNLNAELFTATPTPTSTATPTPTPTTSPTPTPTTSPTPTPTPTITPTVTPTPTTTPTSTATPTPTPTPIPTATPTPTATPAPTSTPAGPLNLILGFWDTGNEGSASMSDAGVLLQDVTAHSQDGTTTIEISAGTQITDTSGQPVDEITIALATSTPPGPEGYFLVEAFDFGPDGTTFTPSMEITLVYDPSQLPAGQAPVIAYYDEAAGEWVFVTGHVNTVNSTITFTIEHFTTFAVMGHSATPAGHDEGFFAPWVWMVIGFTDLLSLVLIIGLLMRRRAATAKVEVESDITQKDEPSR